MLSNLLKKLVGKGAEARRSQRVRTLYDAGLAQKDEGDYEGARESLENAVALDPAHAAAHHMLGILLAREPARYDASARHLERALALDASIPDGWVDLGTIYYWQRDYARAASSFRAALAATPDSVPAHANLGLVLKEAGHIEASVMHLRRAHELAPESGEILRGFVMALIEAGSYDQAMMVSERALARNPDSYEAHFCLGFVSQKTNDLPRALECYDEAMKYRSDDPELHNNRGSAMQFLGRLEEARAGYDRAIELRPDFPLAVFHRGLLRLMCGDYARGWPDYEMRLQSREYGDWPSLFPRWNGSDLTGHTLLVYREQGLGDEIMFSSCLQEVISRASHCVIECAPKLERLFRRSFPAATVYASTPDRALPEPVRASGVDCEIFAGSLPRFYRPDAGSFPRHAGYLKADPLSVERWRLRLATLGEGLKVGISWRGGVPRTRRSVRSLDLDDLLPVLSLPGASFVNLQYDDVSAERSSFEARHGIPVTDWRDATEDYDQTAALVCALDLVISVCTSVIHLTGALGRPVWIMAPYSPEWRYGFAGDTMPWYPSARIFRQPAYGEWNAVIAKVASELSCARRS